MTKPIVNELIPLIQKEIEFLETQKVNLFKTESMVKAVLFNNTFKELPPKVITGYFCILDDIVEQVIHLNDVSIDFLETEVTHFLLTLCK